MKKVKIIGAGSIGNHLAFACRNKNWQVTIADIDAKALERTKNEIYPSRYGQWDENIILTEQCLEDKNFDLVIIGTPPDTHLNIASDILDLSKTPKIILIEKPLATPDLKGCDQLLQKAKEKETTIMVGYNHNLTDNTLQAEAILSKGLIGDPLSIHIRWLEHWGGIFAAHPWLSGPEDSYLGYINRGGGGCCEHSHAIALWLHFAGFLNLGPVKEVISLMDMYSDGQILYDRTSHILLKTETGFHGSVITDVVTDPAQKVMRIQGSDGFIEWYANFDSANDALVYKGKNGDIETIKIPKTRPDDFQNEIDHISQVLDGEKNNSPISLESGLQTMKIAAAAYLGDKEGKKILVDNSGYSLEALRPIQ